MLVVKTALFIGLIVCLLIGAACLPNSPGESSEKPTITIYGFSIMKEVLEKEIVPAFKAKWKKEHNQDLEFVMSFAGSETVTNQILQGVPADVAILSIERDAQRLMQGGATKTDWHSFPN